MFKIRKPTRLRKIMVCFSQCSKWRP